MIAWVPVLLALIAEAAWIAVFAGLLQAFVLHPPTIGIPGLFLAAVAGLVAARQLAPRLGSRWPQVAVALAALAGLVGWLAAPEVRTILRADGVDGLGAALAVNPGGWLAWVAFVRGMAHVRLPVDQRRIATMLVLAVPGLAIAALAGGMITDPWRAGFLAAAEVDVVLFLAAAIPALALARLAVLGQGVGVDWQRNPAWMVLLALLLLATGGAAAWISASAGHLIAMAVSAALAPLLLVGFVVGFDRRSLRVVLISLVAAAAIGILISALGGDPASSPPPPPPPANPSSPDQGGTQVVLGALGLVLVAAVVTVLILARLWARRGTKEAPAEDEIREIDRPADRGRVRIRASRPRFRRGPAVTDAVTAYRALLEAISKRGSVAREPAETPAEHALRLRVDGAGDLSLDLLAADYGLVRFGGVRLTAREERRAIARAAALRRRLTGSPRTAAVTEVRAGAPERGSGPVLRGDRSGTGLGADLPGAEEPGGIATIINRIRRGP